MQRPSFRPSIQTGFLKKCWMQSWRRPSGLPDNRFAVYWYLREVATRAFAFSLAGMIKRELFSSEHEAFRDSVRRFIEDEVAPYHDEWRSNAACRASCG